VIGGYNNYPIGFQGCIPYLLASVVYHQEWLREHLPNQHPLFNSRMFTSELVDRLRDKVLVGHIKCLSTGLTATGPYMLLCSPYMLLIFVVYVGIPAHILHNSTMQSLSTEVDKLCTTVNNLQETMTVTLEGHKQSHRHFSYSFQALL
jgi:hypothetical protein